MAKKDAGLATAFLKKEILSNEKQKIDFKESFEVTKPSIMNNFRGMFPDIKLTEHEEDRIQSILNEHFQPGNMQEDQISDDYKILTGITSEIKSISNQSILLHGERIKIAEDLLKSYKDGAFTEWLLSTYGNRQTPYCMLQYYKLYLSLPMPVRPLIENMPKKAAYTLASREGSLDRKLEIIKNYKGEHQKDVILLIKEKFPLEDGDGRKRAFEDVILGQLHKLISKLEGRKKAFDDIAKAKLSSLLKRLHSLAQ